MPGTLLPTEPVFSAELNISRTAYREAIKVLAAKGVVEPRPKVGTRVQPRNKWNMLDPDVLSWAFSAGPNIKHARALFEVRKIIEPAAVAMAAERRSEEDAARIGAAFTAMDDAGDDIDARIAADLRFHQAILDLSRCSLLRALADNLFIHMRAIRARTIGETDRADKSIIDHMHIIEALEARDTDLAERLVREHTLNLARHVEKYVDYLG